MDAKGVVRDKELRFKRLISFVLAAVLCVTPVLGNGVGSNTLRNTRAAASDLPLIEINNDENFPDLIFRSVIAGAEYDRNGDGYLDADEIARTINIYCEGLGIKSLKGVEFFTALEGLWCKNNQIETMNLTNNKNLHGVWCSGNLFTALDFSANPELEWVYCYDCRLTSLIVSNNPKMAFIECNSNPLPVLDVTGNPLLEHLTCGACQLTSLNLSNNPNLAHLDAFRNHLTSLDVSHNPKLKRLDIWDNAGLGSIDISNNPGLQYYNCAANGATSINVSGNPELQKLICSYNQISGLNLSNNPKLVYLDCACNAISSLDLSRNTQLYFLQAFTNPFTTLNIANNPTLVKTYKTGAMKDESGVGRAHSWTLNYGGDTSTGGDNICFLCFDDAVTLITESAEQKPEPTKEPPAGGGSGFTREKAVQRLYELAGSPGVSGLTSRFTDVQAGASYEAALLWGEKNSIAVGYPNVSSDMFGVGEAVIIQDALLMLMRYSEYKNYKRAIDFGRSDDFSDYYDIDYYAWEAVCWAVTWGIYDGKGDPNAPKEQRRIDPHGNVTSAEFEQMIKNLLEVNSPNSPKVTSMPDGLSPTPTQAPSVTPAQAVSVTPVQTVSVTPAQTVSVTPAQGKPAKDTPTPTPTGPATPTTGPGTPTVTVSVTPGATASVTPGATASVTPVATASVTPGAIASVTPGATPDGTDASGTVTPTAGPGTPSVTVSVMPGANDSATPESETTENMQPPNLLFWILLSLILIVIIITAIVLFVRKKNHRGKI